MARRSTEIRRFDSAEIYRDAALTPSTLSHVQMHLGNLHMDMWMHVRMRLPKHIHLHRMHMHTRSTRSSMHTRTRTLTRMPCS